MNYPTNVNRIEVRRTPDHVRLSQAEGRLAEAGHIIEHPVTRKDYAVVRSIPLASRSHLWVCPIKDVIDDDGCWSDARAEDLVTEVLTYYNGARAYFA